ncbi:hypothetical protein Bca52824_093810 [Brassica carinata]|uniref:AIG1-type G domain-containing protein n=1 Tax=Brassica carinata TaxID=52824 RepID=A0A8X7P5J8_BRACI|nr:hypothetical protein Bca52824_093810 [Brassica carinata]
MDSKAVTPPPEQNPFYASGQSGKTYASVVAAAAASKDGGAVSGAKELDSSPSGDSDKGGADGLSVAEKSSSEVGSDKELATPWLLVHRCLRRKQLEMMMGEPRRWTMMMLKEMVRPEAVSEKTSGEEEKKVEEDGESTLENGSFDGGEKQASADEIVGADKEESSSWRVTQEENKKVEEGLDDVEDNEQKTYASVVAAAAGGAVSTAKDFASSPEAVSGDSDRGIAGGADKEEKSSLEVGADEKVSDEAGSPETAVSKPEAVSEKTTEAVSEKTTEENKKVEEGVDDVEDDGEAKIENKSVDEKVSDEAGSPETAVSKPEAVSEKTSGEEEKKVEEDGESTLENGSFDGGEKQASADEIVGGADKEEKEKSSLEVGVDEEVSNEAASPETASLLSPEQKTSGEDDVGVTEDSKEVEEAGSEKTTGGDDVGVTQEENKKVEEGVDDVEDNEQSGKTYASVVAAAAGGAVRVRSRRSSIRRRRLWLEIRIKVLLAELIKRRRRLPTRLLHRYLRAGGGGTNEDESELSRKVDVDDKIDDVVEEESVELTNKVVDSSTIESVHVDVAKPKVAVVGDVEGIEEVKINADGENLEVANKFDQLGHNDGGGFEVESNKSWRRSAAKAEDLAAKKLSEAARVEPDEPKVGEAEEELHASESLTVGSVDAREDSEPAAELQSEANSNRDAKEVSEGNIAEEDGDKIPVADIVSSREFSLEGKKVDHEPSGGEGVIAVDRSDSEEETEEMIFGSSEAARQFLAELEKASSGIEGHSDEANISNNMSDRIDGQIVTDSEEDVDTEDEGEEKMFDSEALAALLKAATGGGSSEGGNFTITSQDGTKLFSMDRPAGLSSSLRPLKPAAAPRTIRPNIFSNPNVTVDESEVNLSEEEKQKLEKLQNLRVKFLRLLQRLGQSAEDSIAASSLSIALLAGRQTGQLFSLDAAKKKAVEYEAEGNEELNFSLNILVLGKAGVGKSATINSILGNQKASTDAFGLSTNSVREISETVGGIKITFIDTPGLKPAAMDQSANSKMLASVKKVMKRCPPDIVLYVDRLDTQNRDLNNLPLLKTVTASLGASIWKNAICSHIVQQSIDRPLVILRLMNPSLMNPVSLVENHPLCRKNREGVKVLPNGQTWRPQLLLLCYSLKVLSEANSLLKPQEPLDQRKLFGFEVRSRLSVLLPTDQGGDSVDSDIEIDDVSDSEQEDGDEDEYDQLPPFKPLRKTQLAKLSKDQRKAYLEEYDYREMKKNGKKVGENEFGYPGEEEDPENGAPAAVPVPLPDMVLPPSFDSDNSAYRYRFLEPTSQLLTRPVLDTHGWDHDCGYDGVNAEYSLAIASRFPATATVQTTKDKKEFNIHLDSSVSAKHGDSGSTMAGFDIQNGETKFKNLKKNKTTLGGSVTFLGENVATGVKVEDQVSLGKRFVLVGSTGTMRSQGDAAYGANLEVRLKEADFPIGQDQHSLGLSLVKWRGDLALGGNLQSQVSMSGQITVRTSSSDQLQIALTAILPIAMSIYKMLRPEGQ